MGERKPVMAAVARYELPRLKAHMKEDHEMAVSSGRTREQVVNMHRLMHSGETATHEHEDL